MERETKITLLEALVCHSRAILNGRGAKINQIERTIADVVFDRGDYESVTQEENMHDLILWSEKSDREIAKELMKRYEDGLDRRRKW